MLCSAPKLLQPSSASHGPLKSPSPRRHTRRRKMRVPTNGSDMILGSQTIPICHGSFRSMVRRLIVVRGLRRQHFIVTVQHISHSRTISAELWITSDGRAYFVQLYRVEDDEPESEGDNLPGTMTTSAATSEKTSSPSVSNTALRFLPSFIPCIGILSSTITPSR